MKLKRATMPLHSHNWVEEQHRYDDGGRGTSFRSKNGAVPKSFRLDLEFNCYTNALRLSRSNRKLRYVVGFCREVKGGEWGNHAWCVSRNGRIVDPYFEWKFPGQTLEYRK